MSPGVFIKKGKEISYFLLQWKLVGLRAKESWKTQIHSHARLIWQVKTRPNCAKNKKKIRLCKSFQKFIKYAFAARKGKKLFALTYVKVCENHTNI